MKTILYNPIFINPQAYYVFPRLTRYLQPDNESTAEPANYIGTIEVKVIAYGDTTLKRTYTNTDSIDLSEFKNTWIRISLFTKVGSCVLGEWKIGNMESDLPYIDPEVLASLKAVVIVGNKTNNDSDRAIVKNLVDPDNPFVISNAAYTEGSGYADKGSPYYGAFVTDGIDDLITSTKTVQEMLGGSTEFTAVSMVHLISSGQDVGGNAYTNYIRTSDNYWTSNRVSNVGKTGIYGYSFKQGTPTVINNILGDKNDYTTEKSDIVSDSSVSDLFRAKFSVEGFEHVINGAVHVSSVAWYWTIIANKVLTTDQINQVIAYFNLDRTLKPDILCDVKKQGITNENHAEFGDKLIDFSGNGRDIQLNNLAWKGGSGIAAKQYETFKDWTNTPYQTSTVTEIDEFTRVVDSTSNAYWVSMINRTSDFDKVHDSINIVLYQDDMLLVHECKYKIDENVTTKALYETLKSGVNTITLATIDKFTDIPEDAEIMSLGEWVNPKSNKGSVKITLLPSYEGGVLLDGINDFGKVTGMPIYKDYTVIAKYQRLTQQYVSGIGGTCLISKSHTPNQGSFIIDAGSSSFVKTQCYSFGALSSTLVIDNSISCFHYQTKYIFDKQTINTGEGIDSDTLWLGTFRDNDQRFFNGAIYSLMSFPYSMSEFLIERQLKKHKLGTLYPDMVEFRPIIKGGSIFKYLNVTTNEEIFAGDYIHVGDTIRFYVSGISGTANEVSSFTVNGVEGIPKGNNGDLFDAVVTKSPQNINITIDEYIRYEDIVQPYPVLLRFKDENGNEVSWGGKFRVGSTITRIGNFYENNLLDGLYVVRNPKLNGNNLITPTHVVEKSMVFTCDTEYLLDNNEPKSILSPRLLRIPNSSYEILGYIPDISGHGNNGVINNSAYAEGSGVNEDGSYQFDGVDDFVAIPTLSGGGKQVLMKVNWQKDGVILYDQRGNNDEFAIYAYDEVKKDIAYNSRNNGKTYIDGILNKNIKSSELKGLLHNITIINPLNLGISKKIPVIGANSNYNGFFAQMALFDFMLFDDISTDDKIKQLNEYVGIEAKVELPPYYWDAYGKTNLDEDKATIQQRGVAIGDYDLINNNFAYEGMSGYNGYPAVFGTNKTYANLVPNDGNFILTSSHNIINVTKFDTSYGLLYSHIKLDGKLTSRNIDYPSYKIKVTGLGENFGLHYSYLESSSDTTVKGFEINNDGIYIIPKSFASDGSLTSNSDWIGFIFTGTAPESCNVTIEVLPEYENGLVYDGVTDYSENANIPAFTDYTYIFKRTLLNKKYNSASVFKGSNKQSGGGAFICDYNSVEPELMIQGYSFGAGLYANSLNTNDIVYGTKNLVNGAIIAPGNNADVEGLAVGKWRAYRQMVFYKLILYPKTISLLQINFLKNLMERDEIIDLTNPIFIQE